jgi:hypothetical protein
VVAVLDAVAVLVECVAVGVDQDRAERFVAVVQRLAGEFDATAEAFEVIVADRHRPEFTQAALRVRRAGAGRIRVTLELCGT